MEREYRFEVFTDYSSGEKEYVVKYFDFENVIGVGDSIEEAIKDAKGNLDLYLQYCKEQNKQIPEASIHEESSFSGKVTLRMSRSLHRLVDKKSKEEGISLNAYLNEAVAAYANLPHNDDLSSELLDEKVRQIVKETFEYKYTAGIDNAENFNFSSGNKEIIIRKAYA